MNQYLRVFVGILLYGELTLGVFEKWWSPDILLTAVYSTMGVIGIVGSVHYGAKYLQYNSPQYNTPSVKQDIVSNPNQAQEGL